MYESIDTHTTRTVVAQPQPGPRNQDSLPWRWARVGANLIQWGYTFLVLSPQYTLYTISTNVYVYNKLYTVLYSRILISTDLYYIYLLCTPVY